MDAVYNPNRVVAAPSASTAASRPKRAPSGTPWWLAALASLTMVGCAAQNSNSTPFPASPTPAQPQETGHPPPFQPSYCCVAHATPDVSPTIAPGSAAQAR